MAKGRLNKLLGTLREGRPQSLPVLPKRLTANFWSMAPWKTDQQDLDMPGSEDGEQHEATPRLTLDLSLGADFVCEIPEADEAFQAGDEVQTGHDHEVGRRINTKEPVSAIPMPSSSAQGKRKRSSESAHHGLEDKPSAPPDISRKASTKKTLEISSWVNDQPETLDPSGNDAEQAPEFPPSRSNSGDLSVPANTFGVAKEGEQLMGFIQPRSSFPKPSHFPRPLHARAASQDPKTRGTHSLSYGSYRSLDEFQRANREQSFENHNTIGSPPCHVGEHLSPSTLALMRSETPQLSPLWTSPLCLGETRR